MTGGDEREHDKMGHDDRGHDDRGHDDMGHDERGYGVRTNDYRVIITMSTLMQDFKEWPVCSRTAKDVVLDIDRISLQTAFHFKE